MGSNRKVMNGKPFQFFVSKALGIHGPNKPFVKYNTLSCARASKHAARGIPSRDCLGKRKNFAQLLYTIEQSITDCTVTTKVQKKIAYQHMDVCTVCTSYKRLAAYPKEKMQNANNCPDSLNLANFTLERWSFLLTFCKAQIKQQSDSIPNILCRSDSAKQNEVVNLHLE